MGLAGEAEPAARNAGTFVMVLDWLTSTRRVVRTKRDYADDIRRLAAFAAELGHVSAYPPMYSVRCA